MPLSHLLFKLSDLDPNLFLVRLLSLIVLSMDRVEQVIFVGPPTNSHFLNKGLSIRRYPNYQIFNVRFEGDCQVLLALSPRRL